MIMARMFIGAMLTFGSIVVLGVMVLMASDIARLSARKAAEPQRVVYVGHSR